MAVGLGFGAFVAGMLLLAVVLGCAVAAGWVVVRRVAPQLRGLEAGLAWALCATAALLLAHAAPLALGILGRASVLAASVLVLACAVACARRRPRLDPGVAPVVAPRRDGVVVRAAAWVAALLAAGAALAYLRAQVAQPILSSDALNFQLPQVARWIQTGSLWQLDQFFPDYSNATYPQHGNLLLLAAVLPFDSAFLARLVAVPFALMACVGAVACARELGASRGWAVLAAALLAAVPTLDKVALDGAQTDAPMLAFLVTGGLFLLRHRRTGARADLLLAALALGLALGTKWYALTTLPAIGLVWVLARLVARVRPRRVARDAVVLAAVALVAGGLWLVRNWVQAGNPVFPQAIGPWHAPPDPIRARAGFTLAHYALNGDVWSRYLRPTFDAFLAAPGYLLLVAPLAALAVAGRARAGAAAAVAATALALTVAYAVTPYSAFGPEGAPVGAFASVRYALPALAAGAVALAWLGTRLSWPARPLAGAALLVVAALGVREQYQPQTGWAAIVVGAAALVVIARAVRRIRGWSRLRPTIGLNLDHPPGNGWRAGGPAVVAGLAAVVVAVAGAALVRDRGLHRGYAATDPVLAWIERHAPDGRFVGLAGAWSVDGVSPVLPAFGPRLGNRVEYAGPFVEHLLRRPRSQAAFTARLRARRYDVLIVGREGPAPELGWARAAGYSVKVASPRLTLLVRGGP